MPPTILGLDVGGANLKAATADRRAVSVPFALWKQPDRLPAVLAELVGRFPDADELAVTMTGELCDCFETKREGVNAILIAVRNVSRSRPVHVWSTDGVFVDTEEARRHHLKVASANWHALATLAGQYVWAGPAILVDVGSTTTDVIPLLDGRPVAVGKTDTERLVKNELVYTGVRRTPVCAILGSSVAAEFFATAHDAYLLLGKVAPDPTDCDTADGRPATLEHAHARMSRMIGGDPEIIPIEQTTSLADDVMQRQLGWIEYAVRRAAGLLEGMMRKKWRARHLMFVLAGSGEFLAREMISRGLKLDIDLVELNQVRSLTDTLGPEVSACAPAYAVAVLATERRP
jgi:(4-(4-[2-(gamma-L-glutamylamino)ethyl]phenoxymethyl)furan-2-yl)methanamine synthase